MSKEHVNDSLNGGMDDLIDSETGNDLQDYISVKGNMEDIAYAIKKLIEKSGKESDGIFRELAEYDFSDDDYRLIAEFCVDIDSQASEDESYQYSRVFPKLKRLVNIKPITIVCVVLTLIGLAGGSPVSFAGFCATAGGAIGSIISLGDCISEKIRHDLLCVLTIARKRGRGGVLIPASLQRDLEECPYWRVYQKAYKARCKHCSYNPKSATQYECDLTENDIKQKLLEISGVPEYGIVYYPEEDLFRNMPE